ncbi:MAG TPA: MFS transporter [Actinomycetota bacterium]
MAQHNAVRSRSAPVAVRRGAGRSRRPAGVRPMVTVWLAWLVLMTGVNLATPLYAVYADRFRFSSLVLTLVFAAYALTLVISLMLFGRLSDRFGRRVVGFAGLLVACGGLALFAAASSIVWLFAARAVQGLAVGMVSGAATAALVELDPAGEARRPALLAGLAQAAGSGAGPLVAGMLAQWAPAPLRLSFLVLLGATVVAAAFVLTLPRGGGGGEPWRIQLPRVPGEILGDFLRVGLTAGIVWAALALCLSIVPSYSAQLLRTDDLALLGAMAALALAASCVAQVVSRRFHGRPQPAQARGLVVLAAGLAALVLAAPLHSLPLLLVSALAIGVGHGLSFLDAQAELNDMAPSKRRGEITAAFIVCIYVLVGGSVVASGLLGLRLSLQASVGTVAVVLAAAALVTAVWQARSGRRVRGHRRA